MSTNEVWVNAGTLTIYSASSSEVQIVYVEKRIR